MICENSGKCTIILNKAETLKFSVACLHQTMNKKKQEKERKE